MEVQAQQWNTIKRGALTLHVYNAAETSFGVASVLITGATDAVLIDAQFTRPDAEEVAQKILSTGKKLTAIYVSHGDPDFYFGLEVFKKYFPDATVYAAPHTVEHIQKTAQKKLELWGPKLGEVGTKNVVLPQVLQGNSISLEEHRIEIRGLEEFPSRTFVWLPSAKVVLGGINVFGNTFHLWVADAASREQRQEWLAVLKNIQSLHPDIVIPAHAGAGAAFSLLSVQHTKDYLEFYERALATHKTSEELQKAIEKQYPNLSLGIALQIGAKVTTGEMPW